MQERVDKIKELFEIRNQVIEAATSDIVDMIEPLIDSVCNLFNADETHLTLTSLYLIEDHSIVLSGSVEYSSLESIPELVQKISKEQKSLERDFTVAIPIEVAVMDCEEITYFIQQTIDTLYGDNFVLTPEQDAMIKMLPDTTGLKH